MPHRLHKLHGVEIEYILCLSGDHQSFGDNPQAQNVFDLDLAADSPDYTIRIPRDVCGALEFDRADEIIAEGEAAVERSLQDLRDACAVFGRELNGNGGNGNS